MEVEIGDAAGTIWRYLDEHGETTLSRLKQRAKLPEQIVLMAIGWLAREGKLRLVREGRGLKVDLRGGQAACKPVNLLLADLEEFVHDHRPHGSLSADATPPAWNGCLLTVACPRGGVFGRWVTPEDADSDLVPIARLN